MKNPAAKGKGSVGVASGVVLEIDGRFLVLTAAHVVEDSHLLEFALAPRGSSTFDKLTWVHDRPAFRIGGSGISVSGLDIACFEIFSAELSAWGVTPIGLDQVLVYQVGDNEFAILHGYPFERAEIEYGGSRAELAHITFGTVGLPRSEWDTQYRPEIHHILRYPRDDASPIGGTPAGQERLPDPQGISGSGVWIVASRPDRPFSYKDLALVGIEYAWLERRELILANGMDPVLTMIARAFPELAPTILSANVRVQQRGDGRTLP